MQQPRACRINKNVRNWKKKREQIEVNDDDKLRCTKQKQRYSGEKNYEHADYTKAKKIKGEEKIMGLLNIDNNGWETDWWK